MKKPAKNSSKDDEIEQIFKALEDGVSQFMTSDRFKEYLSAMSHFHNYSARNIMLILMQNPNASCVAGYKAWQTKFNRHVKANEKGIRILGYRPQKFKKQELKKDSMGNIIYDEHGPISKRITNRIGKLTKLKQRAPLLSSVLIME